MIYFDNAATSRPKAPGLQNAIARCLEQFGSPGRSGHKMSVSTSRMLFELREEIADMFSFCDPSRVVFFKNVTEAINTALFGILNRGSHVITTDVEHNSTIRPLRYLEANGIDLSLLTPDSSGAIDPDDIRRAKRPNTRLVAVRHGCNVTGTIQPLDAIAEYCCQNELVLLVDAAQTAGHYPLSLVGPIHRNTVYCFTGHKSMLGPSGTGGFLLGENVSVRPLIFGGTGSLSEQEFQPDFLPDMLESGTQNFLGLAGLLHSVRFLQTKGVDSIHKFESSLKEYFIQISQEKLDIQIYPGESVETTGVVSFNLTNFTPSRVGQLLDEKYGICARIGLHCNPMIHKRLKTYPNGTVRFAFSFFNTISEIEHVVDVLDEISSNL